MKDSRRGGRSRGTSSRHLVRSGQSLNNSLYDRELATLIEINKHRDGVAPAISARQFLASHGHIHNLHFLPFELQYRSHLSNQT